MRPLTESDLDFFASVMPEWFGKTPEEGRAKAREWRKLRSREEHEKRVNELIESVRQKVRE